ncbi:lipid-A-disaccharide synthase [Hydrogenophaga intermedia]|uniref:lipid-A-disaccharide synthase n=1 Tax=Hydrogenophaga intermedia TaxID=65786 RepID=UPI0020436AFE|nr:lipid-A-disaccharide synthase [Hydrogenophaga intermedia]MCM3564180.1 lipid-A-disaccharide synthase [Hydrogenophaga intermedia]
MAQPLRLGLVAGEASGDLLAGLLLGGLRQRWPDLQSVGIGGSHMAAQGFEAWWPSDKLAVRGYIEVLRHYREIVGIRTQLQQRLLHGERPAAFIGVDAPDFNLDLEAALKAAGVRTVHFVCPSIWAWRPERIDKIRASADHVLCIFPFEPAMLAEHGIAATYVGHPLANVIPLAPDRAAARRALGLDDSATVVAVLPGSRASEVQYLGRRFLDAVAVLHRERPSLRFVLPAVPALRERIEALAREAGVADAVQIVHGQSHTVLAACDVTLIASGTATLEAALFKRPMVIAYNMNWISWQIMRRKRLQPWVGLPNILCGEFVVPELLQGEANPQALARAVLEWLDAPARVQALQERFTQLHHTLRRDTAQLATDAIETLLAR